MRRISKLPAGLFGATGAVYKITVARDDLKIAEMGAPFLHYWGTRPPDKLAPGFKTALIQLGRPKAPASKK